MEMRPEMQIKAMMKAMTDVILPAVDAKNKLAQEQAHLVLGMLSLMGQRLHLTYRYDRDDLAKLLSLAEELNAKAQAAPGAGESLQALSVSAKKGLDVLDRARAEPQELEAMNLELRDRISALVSHIYNKNDSDSLKPISAALTTHAREQLIRERSWVLPQGWEPDPSAIPAIETLIAGR